MPKVKVKDIVDFNAASILGKIGNGTKIDPQYLEDVIFNQLTQSSPGVFDITPGTITQSMLASAVASQLGSGLGWYNIDTYGAVSDYHSGTDGVMNINSTTLTSATANFVSGDAGKPIMVTKQSGAYLTGTIVSVQSSTSVTLSFSDGATMTGRTFVYGKDNSSAVQAALDAMPSKGGTLYIPAGKFCVQSQLNISKPITLMGEGGGSTWWNYSPFATSDAISTIYTLKDNFRLFYVDAKNVNFKDFSIENWLPYVTGTSSAGIYFNTGYGFKLTGMSIRSFYNNIDMLNAAFWVIDQSYISGFRSNGVIVQCSVLQDAGDWCISNSWFYGEAPNFPIGAGIYQIGSSGGKIVNCKFNTAGVYYPDYHILCSLPGGTSDLIITGNSFENYKKSAIKVTTAAPHVVISGNQFAPIAQINTIDIDAPLAPDITVSGNNFAAADGSSVVTNINTAGIGWNRYYGYAEGNYPASTSTPDTTAPTLSSAVVNNSTPTQIELTYSEALNTSSVPATGDFTVSGGKTVSSVSVSGSKVTVTVNSAYANGNTITISYTGGTNKIKDVAGNNAANLSSQSVTNNIASSGGGTSVASYYFDSNNSNRVITPANNSDFVLPLATSWTIAFKAKIVSAGGNIILGISNGSNIGWDINVLDTGGQYMDAAVMDAGQANYKYCSTSGTKNTVNTQHHYLVVWNGTILKLYVDGADLTNDQSSGTVSSLVSGCTFKIGLVGTYTSQNAQIDDLSFVVKALTPTEVTTLYGTSNQDITSQSWWAGLSSSQKALWKFENNLTDEVGTHNGSATSPNYV